jgi:hypothetical protein
MSQYIPSSAEEIIGRTAQPGNSENVSTNSKECSSGVRLAFLSQSRGCVNASCVEDEEEDEEKRGISGCVDDDLTTNTRPNTITTTSA